MAARSAKAGDWWIISATQLLGGAGLCGIVAVEHGGRVTHLQQSGMVTMATIVGKHEEQRVVERGKRDSSYMATFVDVEYAAFPTTTWARFAAEGEAVLPDPRGETATRASVNTGSRAVFDSLVVGQQVALVVDPDDYLTPELASIVRDFDNRWNIAGAVLLGLLGMVCISQWWRARQRAQT